MTEILRKLQKNIFSITIVTSLVFGMSLAYVASIGIGYYIRSSLPNRTVNTTSKRPRSQNQIPDASKFEGIVTGAFFRGSPKTLSASGENPVSVNAGEITVLGVITGSRDSARALIEEKGKEADALGIGQSIAGYKVLGIRRNYVSFKVGETSIRIKVGEKSEQAISAATVSSTKKSAGVTKKVTLSRQRLKKMITGNQADFVKYNKWTSKIHNGKIVGIKLVYLHPQKSFLYQMGARPGDILRRFNGEKLENQAKMIQLFQSLMTQDKLSVDVERGGKILSFDLIIQ